MDRFAEYKWKEGFLRGGVGERQEKQRVTTKEAPEGVVREALQTDQD